MVICRDLENSMQVVTFFLSLERGMVGRGTLDCGHSRGSGVAGSW